MPTQGNSLAGYPNGHQSETSCRSSTYFCNLYHGRISMTALLRAKVLNGLQLLTVSEVYSFTADSLELESYDLRV